MFSIKDIIDIAVRIEENGEQFFRDAAREFSEPDLASLFHWLADEEAQHARWFKELKAAESKKIENPQLEKMGRALLRDAVGNQLFALSEADLSKIKQVEKLLELAIEFENDTVMFYKMLRPFIEDAEILGQLETIIKEEEQHANKLQEILDGGQIPRPGA